MNCVHVLSLHTFTEEVMSTFAVQVVLLGLRFHTGHKIEIEY